ncbi:MAG TPA: cation:proton antiporter [Solirubrobacteraceae bacterium]|nr:cation:proton antiporter [Solirubrobacteraceae bacterium]
MVAAWSETPSWCSPASSARPGRGDVAGPRGCLRGPPARAGLATTIGRFSTGERIVLAWAGLRGAVPVVLATFPVIEGIPRSLEFFNIVFFAVLVSTVIQGSTIEALARRLNVVGDGPAAGDALRA